MEQYARVILILCQSNPALILEINVKVYLDDFYSFALQRLVGCGTQLDQSRDLNKLFLYHLTVPQGMVCFQANVVTDKLQSNKREAEMFNQQCKNLFPRYLPCECVGRNLLIPPFCGLNLDNHKQTQHTITAYYVTGETARRRHRQARIRHDGVPGILLRS